MTDFLNPNLNLSTRTWHLIAETRDLKNNYPSQSSGLPLSSVIYPTTNRYPLTAITFV